MNNITSFDKPTCRIVSARVEQALKELGEELGLRFKYKGGTFAGSSFNIKLAAETLNDDGSANTQEAENFKSLAHYYGLKAEDLGKSIMIHGRMVEIKGLKPRSHKYPILGFDAVTGKMFKYDADSVKRSLGYKEAV